MRKVYYLIVILFFISCKNEHTDPKNKTEEVNFFLKRISDKNSDEVNMALNDSAFSVAKFQNDTKKARENLDVIANNYYDLNNWKGYENAANELLKISKASRDGYYAKSLRYLGNCFYKEEKLDSAFYYYSKSEKVFLDINDKENYAVVLLKKGIVQFDINDFLGADYSLRKAYNTLKDSNDYQRIYATLNALGSVSSELKEHGRAISYYEKALQVIKEGNISTVEHQEANCLNNIGLVYSDIKNYKKAIFYYEKALQNKNLKSENAYLYAIIIDNLAYSKLKSNDFTQLPQLFFESMASRGDVGNVNSKIVVYIHLSEYYSLKNDTLKAIDYAKKAIIYSNKAKVPLFRIASLKQASSVDKHKSSKYSDEYIKISDSIQIAERKSKDRFARIQLETDEIIQENEGLAERNRDLLYVFVVSFILVALLFVVRAQRARTRELLYKQAQQKANEDIYNLMMSQQAIIDESRSKEKKRLAQDLHDGVLGRMFGLRLNLDSLNSSNEEDAVQKRFALLNELKTIEQDIREISHDLNREKQVLINNFVSIVHNLLEEQKNSFEVNVNYTIDENVVWDKVGNAIKINLYRILQEGLQNINKYANAKNILVEIKGDEENVSLKIQDDGIGFDVNRKSKGIGMQNMISRTHDCKGIIDINSKKDNGTKIVITIPIETKQPITVEQE